MHRVPYDQLEIPHIAILHLFFLINPAVGKEQTAKGGVLYEGGCSAVDYKPVAGHFISDGMSEGNGFSIGNGRSVDAATLEFVDECLVVVGTHTGPASALHLGVENGY